MATLRINDYDLAYIETGSGRPLLMVHGSLCDYRYWAPQMAPFGARHRAIAVSLRRCWPENWEGHGEGYDIDTHVDDLVGFIEALGAGPIDLMGHSRGGHVAFQLARRAPQLLRRLILAEPGGMPDASFGPVDGIDREQAGTWTREAAALIEAGDVDGGLELFIDGVSGMPIWSHTVPGFKRMVRDNARTLLGQLRETRMAFSRTELETMTVPTLLVGGALTPSPFPQLLDLLQTHLPQVQRVSIPGVRHAMNLAAPVPFNKAVLEFLA